MASLQDLINLAKADSGKFFVMDESGEVKLVIMHIDDYEKILVGRIQNTALNIEQINQEITHAQLKDQTDPEPVVTTNEQKSPRVDMREEVIDPSFNFDGPEIDTFSS